MRSLVCAVSGLAVLVTSTLAFDVQATIKRVDVEKGIVVFVSGERERAVKAADDLVVQDSTGAKVAEGLKANALREGAVVTLTIERVEDKPVILAIKLGANRAPQQFVDPATPVDTSKLVPLTDLGTREYQGFAGGLYPRGKNERPAAHEAAGVALARSVQPLDAEGKPSAEGKIVLLSVGFSNTLQSFNGFMRVAKSDHEVSPHVVLVQGAVGGIPASVAQHEDAETITGIGGVRKSVKYWSIVDDRLRAAGVTPKEVQVVWIKETNPAPHQGGFPKYTQELEAQITKIVQLLPKRFPNIKLAYLSSRTFGGWARAPVAQKARGPGNSEPYSYETGFAVKWLIERQLQGDRDLNYDPAQGPVKAPWLSWGPYLWANGERPRTDGYHFEKTDFRADDQMHHSEAGMTKIGNELLRFFKTDATTRPWFLKKT
jgi:hypothetical protein